MTSAELPPVNREIWQDYRATLNFEDPEFESPFIPCVTVASDPDLAEAALRRLATDRRDNPSGLRQSPNWEALLQEDAELPVPIEDDPYARLTISILSNFVERRDREIRTAYPAAIEQIRPGIETGIREGYLLESELDRFNQAARFTAVQVVDAILFPLDQKAAYSSYMDLIEVSANISNYELPVTVAHELLGHKAAGGTFQRAGGIDTTPVRERFGFSEERGPYTQIDEALAQHKALACINGNFAEIDPDKRGDRNQDYLIQRKLVAAMIEKSGGMVDLKTMMRATGEETTEEGIETAERRQMFTQLRKAYGPGALRKLDMLCREAAGVEEFDDDSLQESIDRIHSPVVSAQGNIVPGFIDVDESISIDENLYPED